MDHSIDSDRTLGAAAQVEVSADSDIAVAQRVLRMEADALMDLAAGLDASFARSVGLLAGITGRVVVTGMGKSGHIAPEDRGDAGFHRHAGPMGSSGRGQPWRSRHDRPR